MIVKNYTIVQSIEDYVKLEQHIDSFDYFAFDTETTGLNVRKDKVIGLSICGEIGTAFYLPLFSWDKFNKQLIQLTETVDFVYILERLQSKELLMWNASYDIRIVKNNFNIDLINALFADVMLMKHTVDEEGDFALKKVAIMLQKELGLDAESEANEEQIKMKENVEANGGETTKANFEMYKADLEIMGHYACADADLTMRLAEYYKQKLEEEGLEDFFYDKEVMPLYKEVTIKMEEEGVNLDLPLIYKTKDAIEKDMEMLENQIQEEIMSSFAAKRWRHDLALKSYPPSCKGKFGSKLVELFSVPLPKSEKGTYSFNKKALSLLPESPYKAFLESTGTLPQSELDRVSLAIYEESGDKLNINSKKQMGDIVFTYMGIKPLGLTVGGAPQFDDTLIQHLAEKEQLEWAKKLSNYNKLVKIKGTYIERFLEAQEDGKYYFSYKQHGTISGRYSGDAQQLPRPKEEGELDEIVLKYVNVIRAFFISAPGRIFIDDDYESLEPHVFAHVSGDEGLRDIFRKGHDFYSSIAIPTEDLNGKGLDKLRKELNKELKNGVSADKAVDNYLGKLAKAKRQKAKIYALGIPYGMTDYALGMSLGVSTKEAAVLIDGYLGGFPDLKKWMEHSELQANVLGYVKSEAGRIRHLPKAKELYKTHKKQLLDFKYRQKLERELAPRLGKVLAKAKVIEMYRDYKNSVNNAKNFQIQSLGASIVNAACIAVTREFKRRGINGHVCAQIHDQAIFDVPEDRKEECVQIVKDLMENTTKLSLALKAPPVISHNWKDGH